MVETWRFCINLSWWDKGELFYVHKYFFCPGTLKAYKFCKHIFQPTVFAAVWQCLILLFLDFFLFHIMFFVHFWVFIPCCTIVISDGWTFLEIAKDSKAETFPSFVRLFICHSLRKFPILMIWFWKFVSCSSFYYRRNVYQVFSQFLSLD